MSSLMFLLVGIAGALLRIVRTEVAGETADPYAARARLDAGTVPEVTTWPP